MNSKVLSYLPYFVEVARAKSFRRAAKDLGVPASTISRYISSLEEEIGIRLLNRSTRVVELTEVGSIYFEQCQDILSRLETAHDSLGESIKSPSGVLRISMPVDLATDYLAPAIAEFSRSYPQISFVFDVSPRSVDLFSEPFDLAIRMLLPVSPTTLVVRKLGEISRALYASPRYLESMPEINRPGDLYNHVCLGLTAANEKGWRLRLAEENIEINLSPRFSINSVGLCRVFSVLGLGISALSPRSANKHVVNGELKPVLEGWSLSSVSVYAITESRMLPARTRLFIDHLIKFFSTCDE
ncbi:TPA: LysR substrate-binding domain-containing protein [Pseudomonas aeruginosa]|nr:LysR family transcriptional regulator [Pseudomonas aeruginosa]MBH9226378.1 LysR family transcriptional regulator [Pseudomonas aeruginosa]